MALEYLLAQTRIQAIIDEISDIRQLPQSLRFVNRIPSVPAMDEEILGRYSGRVLAADIIADDQVAVVRAPQPLRLTQTKIPNLKHGEKLTQKWLDTLNRIESNLATARDKSVFDNYIANSLMNLKNGVFHRMEVLLVAMCLDAFSYNRMGIIIDSLGWGMPADLKVTISVAWSDTANATPIADIHAVQRVGREKYGIELNRISLSTTDFDEMTATTEFRNKSALYSQFVLPSAGTFPVADTRMMTGLLEVMTNSVVEIYDNQTWTEDVYGVQTAARYLPVGKILLTAQEGDNNRSFWDWANGDVTEALVAAMFGGGVMAMESGSEGPLSYMTVGDVNLNPPGPILWGAGRGFPRKHKEAASAVLTNP